MILQFLIAVSLAIVATWIVFIGILVVFRPKGFDLAEAKRFVPDLVRLLRELARDDALPRSIRRRLAFVVAYLALPLDLIPDFIPVLGYADDIIVVTLVLRSVVRAAGQDAVKHHWRGSPDGLVLINKLTHEKA